MKLEKNNFQISFSRQLFLVFVLGMLSLAVISSVTTSWVLTKQVRSQIIEKSLQITSNFAAQSYLALIYESPENARDAIDATMSFPDVAGVGIYKPDGTVVTQEGKAIKHKINPEFYQLTGKTPQLLEETHSEIYFIGSVVEPENSYGEVLLSSDKQEKGVLGYVIVAVDKGELLGNRNAIMINHAGIAVVITVLLLLLLQRLLDRITRPLDELSNTMRLAQEGDTSVTASCYGPREIQEIAEVFNNMMYALNERRDELYREKERVMITLESIADGVITTDITGRIIYLNPVAERILGMTTNDAKSRDLVRIFKVFNVATHIEEENPIITCLKKGVMLGPLKHKFFRTEFNDEIYINDSVAPIRNHKGVTTGIVMVFHDETEAILLEEKLQYQATHDALTGLTNRAEFESYLISLLGNIEEQEQHALCYLDLDQFKVINDTCGHMAGDQLLQNITNLLLHRIRKESDTLARLGGDEFILLLENCNLEQASKISNQICDAVKDYRYMYDGQTFSVGVSIGVVPITSQSGDYQDVMSKADSACFMAKEKGRNRVYVYLPDDKEILQRHGEMQTISLITDAFDHDRFELFYQPIVPINNQQDKTSHYEILLRMKDQEGNWISPGFFLPAAERYNMAQKIDRWVIGHVLRWLASHPDHLAQLENCSINLSGTSLNDEYLLPFISEMFEETGVPPEKICFEITETAAITHLSGAGNLITRLRELGCSTALDDFGSGMSSFAYLKNFPVDYLKIDGVFVRDIETDPIDEAMVKSINDIGHILGLTTIAEFVENGAIVERLDEIGVDQLQGYHIAKPRPIDDLLITEPLKISSRD